MIITLASVEDFDRFLETFASIGVAKRREHRCRGAHVVRDPDAPDRIWTFFDWRDEDDEGFPRRSGGTGDRSRASPARAAEDAASRRLLRSLTRQGDVASAPAV